jgi:hypothetical protein
MAFEIRPNTASAFTPREKGEFEFTGNGDIDGEKYAVSVKEAYSGNGRNGKFTSRKVKFEGAETKLTFEGTVFDRRIDNNGNVKVLNEKAPVWTGTVSCQINHELTVTKEVSIWEKVGGKSGLYLSMGIRDKGERPAPQAAQPEMADPF